MGCVIVNQAVEALRSAGIRAGEAWAGGAAVDPEGVVAAVSLNRADRAERLEQVKVSILGPGKLGGGVCEEMGVAVCDALEALGAGCSQGPCEFLEELDLFRVEVLADFVTEQAQSPGEEPVVYSFRATLAGVEIGNLVSATAYRIWDQEQGALTTKWMLRLEEQIIGEENTQSIPEPFEVRVIRTGQTEVYVGGVWNSWRRVLDGTGLRQIREIRCSARRVE